MWLGRGAAALGLSGDIDEEALRHLLAGPGPDGSTALVEPVLRADPARGQQGGTVLLDRRAAHGGNRRALVGARARRRGVGLVESDRVVRALSGAFWLNAEQNEMVHAPLTSGTGVDVVGAVVHRSGSGPPPSGVAGRTMTPPAPTRTRRSDGRGLRPRPCPARRRPGPGG